MAVDTIGTLRSRPKSRYDLRYDAFESAGRSTGCFSRAIRFFTNNLEIDASTIARIYRQHWQIEVLFKRIKQNYPLQYFLGDNENAINIQIWCALIADLLLKVIRKGCERDWSFANLASMVRHHLMNYIDLRGFLNNPEKAILEARRMRTAQRVWRLFPT